MWVNLSDLSVMVIFNLLSKGVKQESMRKGLTNEHRNKYNSNKNHFLLLFFLISSIW